MYLFTCMHQTHCALDHSSTQESPCGRDQYEIVAEFSGVGVGGGNPVGWAKQGMELDA